MRAWEFIVETVRDPSQWFDPLCDRIAKEIKTSGSSLRASDITEDIYSTFRRIKANKPLTNVLELTKNFKKAQDTMEIANWKEVGNSSSWKFFANEVAYNNNPSLNKGSHNTYKVYFSFNVDLMKTGAEPINIWKNILQKISADSELSTKIHQSKMTKKFMDFNNDVDNMIFYSLEKTPIIKLHSLVSSDSNISKYIDDTDRNPTLHSKTGATLTRNQFGYDTGGESDSSKRALIASQEIVKDVQKHAYDTYFSIEQISHRVALIISAVFNEDIEGDDNNEVYSYRYNKNNKNNKDNKDNKKPSGHSAVELSYNGKTILKINIETQIGRGSLKPYGSDYQFFADKQFKIFKSPDGKWMISPYNNTPNETLVDGKVIKGNILLRDGMKISVGNSSKGIEKFPLVVKLEK